MGLTLPVTGVETGPNWANEILAALNLIDAHDHTTSKGAEIPFSAINVNDDVDMGDNSMINIKSLFFNNQSLPYVENATLYISGGELYYNNSSGVPLQITIGGALNGVTGSHGIGGDYGNMGCTALVRYLNASGIFEFLASGTVYAPIYASDISIYEGVAGAHKVKLKTVAGLGGDVTITLPSTLPISTLPMSISATGVITSAQIIAAQITNNTITATQIANNTISATQIVNKTITAAQIADGSIVSPLIPANAITTALIADAQITPAKRSALGQQIATIPNTIYNAGSGSQTSGVLSTVTITSTGRPINVIVDIEECVAQAGYSYIHLYRNGVLVRKWDVVGDPSGGTYKLSCLNGSYIDVIGAGTYSYTVKFEKVISSGDGLHQIVGLSAGYAGILAAYEL